MPRAASPSSSLGDIILAAETATWRDLQGSSATGAAMLDHITSDCTMQLPPGLQLTATTTPSLDAVLRSPEFVPWKAFELLDVKVQELGVGGALISYRVVATRMAAAEGRDADPEVEIEALCVSGWREVRSGEWRLAFHQQTSCGVAQ